MRHFQAKISKIFCGRGTSPSPDTTPTGEGDIPSADHTRNGEGELPPQTPPTSVPATPQCLAVAVTARLDPLQIIFPISTMALSAISDQAWVGWSMFVQHVWGIGCLSSIYRPSCIKVQCAGGLSTQINSRCTKFYNRITSTRTTYQLGKLLQISDRKDSFYRCF